MNDLRPFAERMLREHREFFPFGGRMKLDGTIVWEGAQEEGNEHPQSQTLIDILLDAHQRQANEGQIKACATIYDVRVIPPGKAEKQDAIAIALDHCDGYSVVVFFPYYFGADGELNIEEPFANPGSAVVFGETRG